MTTNKSRISRIKRTIQGFYVLITDKNTTKANKAKYHRYLKDAREELKSLEADNGQD